MRGALVQAEMRVVTAGEEAVERLRRAARMAGVEIDKVLSSVVAAGRAAVQRAEADDRRRPYGHRSGHDRRGYLFERHAAANGGGACRRPSIFPATSQRRSTRRFSVGEGVLHDHGAASLEGAALGEEVTIPCYGVSGYRRFRRGYLLEVIRLRLTELLQLGWAAAMGARRWKRIRQASCSPAASPCFPASLTWPARCSAFPPVWGEAAGGILYREGGAVSDLRGPAHASLLGLLRTYHDPVLGPVWREAERPKGFRLFGQVEGLRA